MIKSILIFGVLSLSLASTAGCEKSCFQSKYGVFKVKNDSTATMNGTISSRTDNQFKKLMENHPNIKWIELGDCPGSKDDETNLKLSKEIHDRGISTRVLSDSEIASGAVDLFLAGNKREIESGAKIGVHSWGGGSVAAKDLPKGHENHVLYIDYYVSVGFTQQQAEEFYYFTINAAPANSIHWMTDSEIELYNMATN
jgi:hypothetical protein